MLLMQLIIPISSPRSRYKACPYHRRYSAIASIFAAGTSTRLRRQSATRCATDRSYTDSAFTPDYCIPAASDGTAPRRHIVQAGEVIFHRRDNRPLRGWRFARSSTARGRQRGVLLAVLRRGYRASRRSHPGAGVKGIATHLLQKFIPAGVSVEAAAIALTHQEGLVFRIRLADVGTRPNVDAASRPRNSPDRHESSSAYRRVLPVGDPPVQWRTGAEYYYHCRRTTQAVYRRSASCSAARPFAVAPDIELPVGTLIFSIVEPFMLGRWFSTISGTCGYHPGLRLRHRGHQSQPSYGGGIDSGVVRLSWRYPPAVSFRQRQPGGVDPSFCR